LCIEKRQIEMTEDENAPSGSGGVRQRRGAESQPQEGAPLPPQPRVNGFSEDDDEDGRVLNPDELDKLAQLQDLTGIDDSEVCRALLESKEWDLEATVREHMNLPSQPPERRSVPERPINPLPEVPNARVALHNHARRNRRGEAGGGIMSRLFDWGFFLLLLPVTVPYRVASIAFRGIYSIAAVIFGLPALGGAAGRGRRAVGQGTDPVADIRLFRESFEIKYGPVHPAFHPGSYSQVIDEAKRELSFLVVYLHCADHQDVERFCSGTLTNSGLVDFVTDNNILFWGCSVDTGEGYRVSQALRESTYPFLAVIVLRQNRMMVVGRVEGHIEAAPLVQKLEAVVRENEAYVVAARHERLERSQNQNIREEQDRAFQETLRQDQEKERKRIEEEEAKKREEDETLRMDREEKQRKDLIQRRKVELASEVPEEPEAGHSDSVRVLVKLPGGQRLERRFLKSHSLKYLYYYVFCHPESPDEFDITTNFPKKVLQCRPEQDPTSFEEAGLGTSTMLFVNDLEA
jgi:FAS-associated factor 2